MAVEGVIDVEMSQRATYPISGSDILDGKTKISLHVERSALNESARARAAGENWG